ncbi:Uncharacterised protein [Enterobacter cloacae]|nr:Uncharacterised protein [Enterobacter cloacae]
MRHQRIHGRIQEDRQRTEDNYRRDGNRDFTGFGFNDGFCCQYRRRAADAATRTDQPAGLFVQPKDLLADKARQ